MCTEATLLRIGNSDGSRFDFDVSKINKDLYRDLLSTLKEYGKRKIVSLGLNCNARQRKEYRATEEYQNSIFAHHEHCILNFVELFAFLIANSESITEVTFSALQLSQGLIAKIAKGASLSNKLVSIAFTNTTIGDQNLQAILSVLNTNVIRRLTFWNCNLTSQSTPFILDFLAKGNIHQFNVSRTEFTNEEIDRIRQSLSPEAIDEEPIADHMGVKVAEDLRVENQRLREKIKELRKSMNAIKYRDGVYIVGKGAHEFIDFIESVEEKIEAIRNH